MAEEDGRVRMEVYPTPHKIPNNQKHIPAAGGGATAGGYNGGMDYKKKPRYNPPNARRAVCTFLLIILVLIGITVLVLWLVYRPHKPKFTVVGAAIYNLNTASPPYISTTMQFTLITRNPNDRVSIYYDHLSAFVSYKGQPITPLLMLPPFYHGSNTVVALSPVLGGGAVPVSPEVVNGLGRDEAYGAVNLRLVLMGKLRWKAGAIRTGRYGITVRCDVFVGFKKGVAGQIPLLGSPVCDVDI